MATSIHRIRQGQGAKVQVCSFGSAGNSQCFTCHGGWGGPVGRCTRVANATGQTICICIIVQFYHSESLISKEQHIHQISSLMSIFKYSISIREHIAHTKIQFTVSQDMEKRYRDFGIQAEAWSHPWGASMRWSHTHTYLKKIMHCICFACSMMLMFALFKVMFCVDTVKSCLVCLIHGSTGCHLPCTLTGSDLWLPKPSYPEVNFLTCQAPTKDNAAQTDASWNELALEKLRQEKKKKKKAANTKEDSGQPCDWGHEMWFHHPKFESDFQKVRDIKVPFCLQEVVNQQRSRAANLTPIDKLKEKATAAAMKKQYSVFDYYRHLTALSFAPCHAR